MLAMVIYIVSRLVREDESTAWWVRGVTASSVGYLLIILRGIVPDFFSIIVANVLIGWAWPHFYIGLRRYFHLENGMRWDVVAAAVVVVTFVPLTYVWPDVRYRVMLNSLLIALSTMGCAWVFFRYVRSNLKLLRGYLIVIFASSGCVFMLRGIVTPLSSVSGDLLVINDLIQPITFAWGTFFHMALAGGLPLLLAAMARRDLAESEEAQFSLIAALPDVIMRFDREGRHLFVSENVTTVVPIPAAHFIGKTHHELGFPEPLCAFWEHGIRQAFLTQQPYETEFEFEGPAGHTVFNWRLTPDFDAEGRVRTVLAVARDVTERKRAESAIRQSEANYRELVDNVNAIILRMAPDGTVTYFNQFAECYFGYRAAEILGRHVVGTIVPETESNTGRDLSGLIKNILANPEQYADNENENMTRDGRKVFVRWANQVILDENQQPSGVLSIGTDITVQKKAEELLTLAKDAAESANVAKSQFLATMSHEIRTPLNGILGMAQMLLMDNIDETERRDFARTIRNSGETLLTLLNDILDFSKIEAGKLELDNSVIDPEQILYETANLFQENAVSKGLVLEAGWDGAQSERAKHYLADPHRLRQMISNLTNNAIKFTSQGMVSLKVREVERLNNTALLEFSVSDTGIGIDAEKQELLFKPFSQADSSITRQFGGTGLGLSIVRSLAQKMGGDIGVTSTPGQGSRFWFRIRADIVLDEIDRRSSARINEEMTISSGQLTGNILVVEDNLTNQKVIQTLLKKLGLSCQIADDGLAGVQAIERDPTIDLILMDVQMPVMDGYEATRAIRARESETRSRHLSIIAMTANAYDEDRQRCLDSGMDDFLAKPVSFDKLTLALQRWLPPESVAEQQRHDQIEWSHCRTAEQQRPVV